MNEVSIFFLLFGAGGVGVGICFPLAPHVVDIPLAKRLHMEQPFLGEDVASALWRRGWGWSGGVELGVVAVLPREELGGDPFAEVDLQLGALDGDGIENGASVLGDDGGVG